MNNKNIKIRLALQAIGLVLIAGGFHHTFAQELKWLRVSQLQSFFMDFGTECETYPFTTTNFLAWPAQYGDGQWMSRAKGVWMGATNFYDPVEKKVKSYKVIGAGPRYDQANLTAQIFSNTIKLIGRENPPKVYVDNTDGSSNSAYDVLDEVDPNLPCDRMVVINYNTSMGVSVTKKVLAFTQQNHDNYFIHDYVFKNTGVYNTAGDTTRRTITNFWVFFNYRHAMAGITTYGGSGSTWGSFDAEWGDAITDDFGPPYRERPDSLRGFYAFYAPVKSSWGQRNAVMAKGYDWDWGCPKQTGGGKNLDGLMGAAKFVGCVTLHASKGPGNLFNVDDYNQPATVNYANPDGVPALTPYSQYDENFMGLRWAQMTEGHLAQSLWQAVGDGRYYADWMNTDPLHPQGGQMGQGYGPYTLAPGDSIHIVFAEGASGISWEKCREIGANWYPYYTGTGTPQLIKPDGSVTTSVTDYQKTWVWTGKDSIIQTYKNARANYRSGYNIPQAPPAPSLFMVVSGGDRVRLSWADNAKSSPHFNGYVVYRSESLVKDYRAVYEKVFECDKNYVFPGSGSPQWDDTSAHRGFNYYYYVQSKDDGTQNDVKPGAPLYSSLFLTLTTVPAHLLRPSGNLLGEVRVVPNPYDIRSRKWQFGEVGPYDRIIFYGIPPKCRLKIFTEDGVLIWEKLHTNGSGDEYWDSKTSSNQIVVSGIYILHVEVTEDTYATENKIAKYDIFDENLKLMYPKDALMFNAGEKIFSVGQSTFRKFVVIR
ncbi:MAG: hypothetical protein ABSD46_05970 [Bacteroidota bacterium]